MTTALIVGLGSIGRRHLSNLRALRPDLRIVVWRHTDQGPGSDEALAADRTVFRLEDALDNAPRLALITGPAPVHVSQALALARAGVHLLIEKPLSDRLDGVDSLIAQCHAQRLALVVGYNFRFHEPLRTVRRLLAEGAIGEIFSIRAEVGQYLPDWRPGIDYRESVSARRSLGGGVLLELSHEIDYVRWLAGEVREVIACAAQIGRLSIDVEDMAEIVLRFDNGAVGSVHLDMLQRAPTRACRIVGSDGTLCWDGITDEVRVYSAARREWSVCSPAAPHDRNAMYLAELEHFLACADGQASPAVTGEDGRRVLQIALAAAQSSREGRVIAV